jgi:hypothetical protein
MVRNPDHRVVSREFRQQAGVDAIDFEEIQRRLYRRPFVPVEVRLALRIWKA